VDLRVCHCGQRVRLRASRITYGGWFGIAHWIEHVDGTRVCIPGEWSCATFKPYPKRAEDHEYFKLMRRWDEASPAPDARSGREGA
jgi:hypothetical protein